MALAGRWPTIRNAALLAGTLDMLAACVYYFIKTGETKFYLIPMFIASAAFGKGAFSGGTGIVLLGLLMHYGIAFFWTLFFFWLYQQWTFPGKSRWWTAAVYGVFVWLIMNRVVVPFTRIAHRPFDPVNALINIGILMVCIGWPLSWMAHRSYKTPANG